MYGYHLLLNRRVTTHTSAVRQGEEEGDVYEQEEDEEEEGDEGPGEVEQKNVGRCIFSIK